MIGMIPLVGKKVYLLGKTLSGGREHPVSEAQRRWAWAAEDKGELPEGKAYEWSKRVKGQHLPKHTKDFKPVKKAIPAMKFGDLLKAIPGMETAYGKKWRGGKPYPDTEEKTEPGNQVPYNQAHYDKQYSEAAKPQASSGNPNLRKDRWGMGQRPVGKSGNGVEDQSKRGSTGISEEEKDWDKQNRHPQDHAYNDEQEANVNAAKKHRGMAAKAFPQPADEGPMGGDLPRRAAQPQQPRAAAPARPAAPKPAAPSAPSSRSPFHDDEDTGPYGQTRTNPTPYRGVGMKALVRPQGGGKKKPEDDYEPAQGMLGSNAFSPSTIGSPDKGDALMSRKTGRQAGERMQRYHAPGPGDKRYSGAFKGILFIVRLFKAVKQVPSHVRGGKQVKPYSAGFKEGRQLGVPERHQLKIARDTLNMPDAMAGVMGGPSKEEAREIIKRLTGRSPNEERSREESEHKVGDDVHLGFGTKGGAGFRGKIHKIEGDSVHITNDEGRTFKGPMKHVSKAVKHPHAGRPGQVGGSTRMQMQNDYDRHPGPTQRHKLDDIERTHGVRNVKTNSKGTIVDFERGGEGEDDAERSHADIEETIAERGATMPRKEWEGVRGEMDRKHPAPEESTPDDLDWVKRGDPSQRVKDIMKHHGR